MIMKIIKEKIQSLKKTINFPEDSPVSAHKYAEIERLRCLKENSKDTNSSPFPAHMQKINFISSVHHK